MSRSAVALARLALPPSLPTPDAQLLGAFVSSRAEDPFAELVRRHGPMVLAVCRRVLADAHDAEDAFQATFLVLARKANSVRGSNVAGWLYGVAVRTARGVRVARDRRQKRLSPNSESGARERESGPAPEDALAVTEQAGIIDEELAKLPERYREAVVLCELRGLSRHEAAAELGVPEGTVSSRLASAKRKLAERLTARGLTPAVALAALAGGSATVSAGLARATAAAVRGAVGGTAGAAADAVLKAMLFEQLRACALAGAMCFALVCGGLAMTGSANAPPADARTTAPTPRPTDDPAAHLVGRLGSADFAEREAAEKALRALGPKAEPALKGGLRSDDPEVRARCAAVLAAVRKDALDALVKQFDPKAEKPFEHPIWARFQAIAGNTSASRELFARILKRAEWSRRLAAAEAGPEAAAQQYSEAITEVGRRYRANLHVFFFIPTWPCDLAEEAAYLLFLGSYPGTETALKGTTSAALFADGEGRLHYAQGLSLGLIGKEIAPGSDKRYDATASLPPGSDRVFWKLLGAWLPRRANASVLFNSFHLALRARAADVLPAARTIAGDEKRSAGERVGAFWAVAQFGDTSDLPLFAKLYNDPTDVILPPPPTGNSPGPRSRRLRADDSALALALLLCDRDPAEFGFSYAKGKLLRESGRPVLANYEAEAFGFSDDKARTTAHAKAKAFLAEQKPKEPPAPDAASLVRRLGSADFAEREAAEKALRALGPKAESALKGGLRSDDPEVRARCAAVLTGIRNDALDALVKRFDPNAEKPFEHPLWTRFQTVAGNTPASRELFARIIANKKWLTTLDRAEHDPATAGHIYRVGFAEVFRDFDKDPAKSPPWPCYRGDEVAYLLLLGSHPDPNPPAKLTGDEVFPTSLRNTNFLGRGITHSEAQITHGRGLPLGLTGQWLDTSKDEHPAVAGPPGTDRVFAKLFAAWLVQRPVSSDVVPPAFRLVSAHRVTELLPLARKYAANDFEPKRDIPPLATAAALETVAQLGTAADLPLFERHFTDKTDLTPDRATREYHPLPAPNTTQLRDLALGLALLLHGRDPADFGFTVSKDAFKKKGNRYEIAWYSHTLLGFPDDKTRATAHAKAGAFLAEQKPKPNEKGAPFWPRFATLLGDDEASRALFDLIASEPKNLELLERAEALLKKADAPDAGPDALFAPENLYLARRDELNEAAEAKKPVALAAVYGWMYLGTFPHTNHPAKASRALQFMPQESRKPEQTELVRHLTGPNGSAGKRLLGAWAERQTANGSSRIALELALRYDIKEALGAARKVLAEALRVRPDDLNGPQVGTALLLVGKYGSEADAPAVAKLLTNAKEFYGHRPGKPTNAFVEGKHISNQVRDTAAVVLIVLRKGKPEDFGFIWTKTEAAKLVPWAGQLGTDPLDVQIIGFSTDADRAAAHKKVKEWLDKPKPKEPPHPDAAKLIRQLGSAVPAEREAAENQLKRLGAAAKPDLLAGVKSGNQEVARRCAAILSAVRQSDWQRARDSFAARPEAFDHPVWQKLKSVTGGDADAPAILADLLADEGAFVALVEALDDPNAAPELHRAAHARLTQNLKDWYAADKARNAVTAMTQWAPARGVYPALLLLGTFPGTGAAPAYRVGAERSQADHAEWHVCWCGLTATEPRPKNGGMRRPSAALQRLFVAWLGARENPDAAAAGFSTLLTFECREGSALARTVAEDAKRTPRSRGQALLYLGQVGTAPDAAVAARAFDDAREFSSSRERSIQVRDIATAVALELSGEKPAEWGFSVEPRAGASKNVAPRITGFTSDFVRAPFLKAAQEKVAELIAARSATPPPRTKP